MDFDTQCPMTATDIQNRILASFPGARVEVQDYTGTHDHFEVLVKTNAFEGLSRIARHRAVMDLFQKELHSGEIHAFTLKTETNG